MTATAPEWIEGLPQDVVDVIRQEAARRGISSRLLIKEWTLQTAASLLQSTLPAAASSPSGQTPTTEARP